MRDDHRQFMSGVRATTAWTIVSRVLGLVRDMVIAALLGLSGKGVADALVIALRIPNLFRQLFGEGALTASYLPVFAARMEESRSSAWQLFSVMLTWLSLLLALLVVLVEAIFGGIWLAYPSDRSLALLLALSAVTFPYMLLICIASQISATLNALGKFGLPAFVPVVLNLALIAGALAAPHITSHQPSQAFLLSGCVLFGGVLQIAIQWPALRRLGFRYDYQPAAVRTSLMRIGRTLLPMIAGLAVTQVNTLLDSLIAFGLSDHGGPSRGIAWLGGHIDYPMRPGAAAAIYYGERLYQLPLGILGGTVATVIFPLLSRHAAQGNKDRLGADLTLGLQLVAFLSLPASVGLVMLAEPLARLLFEHGQFTNADALRTARMIACFGAGVWAYCAVPVLARGYYALGRHAEVVRIGLVAVTLNLTLDVTLIWFWAEAGLAIATSVASGAQVVLLTWILARSHTPLRLRSLAATLARSVFATATMAGCGYTTLALLPAHRGAGRLLEVALPLGVSVAAYLAVSAAVGSPELRFLWRFGSRPAR